MNKKFLIPLVALTIIGGSAVAVSITKADEEANFPPIIQRLVEKFNLDEAEVTKVLEEAREERQAEMQARFTERLDQAVSDGTITEEQKQLIVAKHEELEALRQEEAQNRGNYSPEEWQTKMQERREEMKSWAEENGIDLSVLMPEPGGMGGHRQGPRGEGMGIGI